MVWIWMVIETTQNIVICYETTQQILIAYNLLPGDVLHTDGYYYIPSTF